MSVLVIFPSVLLSFNSTSSNPFHLVPASGSVRINCTILYESKQATRNHSLANTTPGSMRSLILQVTRQSVLSLGLARMSLRSCKNGLDTLLGSSLAQLARQVPNKGF